MHAHIYIYIYMYTHMSSALARTNPRTPSTPKLSNTGPNLSQKVLFDFTPLSILIAITL